METTCTWPPTSEQRAHLAVLAELIHVGGAERFALLHLVGANLRLDRLEEIERESATSP